MISESLEYKTWLIELKSNIKSSQIKAALAVNSELIELYWNLGQQITDKQSNAKWGSGFIEQLSKDLKNEFPHMSGFSDKNLRNCRAFFSYYFNEKLIWKQFVSINKDNEFKENLNFDVELLNLPIWKQAVSELKNQLFKIPWGHHIKIIQKIKNYEEAIFYIQQTQENNWSRSILEYQIESNLFQRKGKAITNFKYTLPEPESDLANSILKDKYNFEFLMLSDNVKEIELEQKLIENITQFLLELGKGFAYLGRQYEIKVGGDIFKTDLLFYHTKLRSYVVIELKVNKFKPEYIGKLNFYVNAIDKLVKDKLDNPTIGILLCKSKNDVVVDFALQDINKPLGVSEYSYKQLPENFRKALPSKEEFEAQLNQDN